MPRPQACIACDKVGSGVGRMPSAMDTVTHTQQPARSAHAIPVRKPQLEFGPSIRRYWMDDNIVATHFFNGLNLLFPDGERFFVKAVYDHLDRITDPVLLEQAKGFAGQEGQHAHEHEKYFDCLRAQGYEIDRFLRRFHGVYRLATRWFPAPLRLAMTAGAEHYTAIFGAGAIDDFPLLGNVDPTMRALIVWHATEEIEHKAVAFDILRATHPSYLLRLAGFVLATAAVFGFSLTATRMLIKQDRIPRAVARAHRKRAEAANDHQDLARLLAGVRAYVRPSFHPSETDHLEVARRRLAEVLPAVAG
jgi:predicted metal-dependent hydrolase